MGVDYYLYDEPRKELFLLGRGSRTGWARR